jgi:acyl transferase domain-containing protein
MATDQGPDYQRLLADALRQIRSLKAERAPVPAVPPVAVIGVGCRFPGDASSPDAYWDMLMGGGDGIIELPPGRWDQVAFFQSLGAAGAERRRVHGGFLRHVDGFDPEFFGISPREAADIDPQQRLLLEVAYEALQHAGVPAATLAGSDTGVYVGVHNQSSDYFFLQADDPASVTPHSATGTAHNVAAGRLAYLWDLRGPAMAVDTACSASLVAVHLACQSLRTGETRMALAGGVNLRLLPLFPTATARMGDWPADYRCKTFDARADGVISGEGCGVVVLKRLDDALKDGDPVRAVILGSAINQDGASLGLTAPNAEAQRAVIARALSMAGRRGAEVGYVETHGTGTPLGDPIEFEALAEALSGPPDAGPCLLGAVKTNFGHLEGAAGVAGLVKAVLAVERGAVPPNLHFQTPNPDIPFAGTRFRVPTEPTPWLGAERLAGVSSFGWSGTNAHVVLAPPPTLADVPAGDDGAVLLPLSARSLPALHALAGRTRKKLSDAAAPAVLNLAYTAARRRDHHRCRLAVVGFDHAALAAALADGEPVESVAGPVIYVFSGQGGLWRGAASGLAAREPVFRAALGEVDAAVTRAFGHGIADLLTVRPDGAPVPVDDPVQAAAGLFALQVALCALYRHWGAEPDTVIGHSLGEVAAAHVAGALPLDAAARVVATRTRLAMTAPAGATAALALGADAARTEIARLGLDLTLAALNGPAAVAVSGGGAEVDRLVANLTARGVTATRLAVPIAFHGPRMDGPAAALATAPMELGSVPPRIPMVSTVTGAPLSTTPDAAYWARNLREKVDFAGAVGHSLGAVGPAAVFVEIGPHPALSAAIVQTAAARNRAARVVPTLRRGADDRVAALAALGRLYETGYDGIRWDRLYPAGRVVDLPLYPWQRRRFWHVGSGTPRPVVAALPVPLYSPAWVATPPLFSGGGPLRVRALGDGAEARALAAALATTPDAAADTPLVLVADASVPATELVVEAAAVLAGSQGRVHLVTLGETPGGGALWGLHRGFAAEHPERAGHRLTLPAGGGITTRIAAVLAAPGSDEFRLDGDTLCRRRLIAREAMAAAPDLRADGTYLVTGGMGGLGQELARWLVKRGAGHVVLLSRRAERAGPKEMVGDAVEERAGLLSDGRVTTLAADCSDADAMAAALDDIRRRLPPLRGVIHAAAVLDDGILAAQTPQRIRAVLAPKLEAALLLDRLTTDDPLDLFVLCSSLAGLLGAPGQAVYAAANSGLDALAEARRAVGRPALSIAWPVIAGTGMADGRDRAGDIGLEALTPTQAMVALQSALGLADAAVVAPLAVDWSRFRGLRSGVAAAPLIADLVRGGEAIAAGPGRDLRAEMLELPPAARRPAIERVLAGMAVRVLAAGPMDAGPAMLDVAAPLLRQGLDSFSAIELHRHIEQAFGVALPLAASLAGGSIAMLAHELDRLLAEPADELAALATKADAGELTRLMAELDGLSDAEVEALLAVEAGGGMP